MYSSIPSFLSTAELPIVYSPGYNIRIPSCFHAFDTQKYSKILDCLECHVLDIRDRIQSPSLDVDTLLAASHDPEYLDSLQSSRGIAEALEISFLRWIPACILRRTVAASMRLQYAGSVQAAHLAHHRGWGINLGGGFHHASRAAGGGFCMYNDITAVVQSLLELGKARRVMIIDFDAHQGDGYEADLRAEVAAGQVHIVDAYCPEMYNDWHDTRRVIGTKIHYSCRDDGSRFLAQIREKVPAAVAAFQPDFVVYNAGTDVMAGDRYGDLQFREETIVERDEIVWSACGFRATGPTSRITQKGTVIRKRRATATATTATATAQTAATTATTATTATPTPIPIVMLLSGGYQAKTAAVIAASFLNLFQKFDLLRT